MTDIQVRFVHPVDGSELSVTLDAAMTSDEAITNLIVNDWLLPLELGYTIIPVGAAQLRGDSTFAAAGVVSGHRLRVVPATDAGGGDAYRPDLNEEVRRGIPGLDRASIKDFTLDEARSSPQAVVMIAHMYEEAQRQNVVLKRSLELERRRSADRFIATLLLFISQVVLGIGGNLLTINRPVAVAVLCSGCLQATLALYLTFRHTREDG